MTRAPRSEEGYQLIGCTRYGNVSSLKTVRSATGATISSSPAMCIYRKIGEVCLNPCYLCHLSHLLHRYLKVPSSRALLRSSVPADGLVTQTLRPWPCPIPARLLDTNPCHLRSLAPSAVVTSTCSHMATGLLSYRIHTPNMPGCSHWKGTVAR